MDKENKYLLKLRTVVTHLLKPRFLYACSAERILFYDNAWKGLDAGEFKQVTSFMSLEEMKLIVLKKIKDVFASNLASKRSIDEKDIFGNPIYERLIGSYDEINKKFGGKFNAVMADLKQMFCIVS